jgi:uncharacterized protein YgiM (DUF1202 family)
MIETKRRSTILNVVLTAIILMIGFLFWPGKEKFNQSNPRDVNKNQIKIVVKALNIRKEPTVESEDIGTVYEGELFTVLEHIDKDDYYWYKIKTKQGKTGYIASDINNEYVKVINGQIDREAPVITSKKEVLIFKNGEENYEDIECTDNYTKCKLEFDDSNPEYIVVNAIDEAGNKATFQINYYKVYDLSTIFTDNNKNVHATFTKKISNNYTIISANYITNKEILKDNKSNTYTPIVEYYDENFKKVEDMYTLINKQKLAGTCINDENNNLKQEYLDSDIPKGSILCMNYSFADKNNIVKYIAVGFQGIENFDKDDNILSRYNSDYFEIE